MTPYTALILGPAGSSRRIDILAADADHARELARKHGAGLFGARGFTYIVVRQA